MNRDEKLVAEWLRSKGHEVRHLTDGGDPPDLVVDCDIAVEVTTINSSSHTSIWQFLDETFKSLGPAENGRGYWVSIDYEDETMFQAAGKNKRRKMKAELRQHIKRALNDHYREPGFGNPATWTYRIALRPHVEDHRRYHRQPRRMQIPSRLLRGTHGWACCHGVDRRYPSRHQEEVRQQQNSGAGGELSRVVVGGHRCLLQCWSFGSG